MNSGLFLSEWERMWKRKITWLFLFAMPAVVAATAKYYAGHNRVIPPASAEYTWAGNFPVMALIEQLIVVFNVMSLILLTLSVTEEYRSGQIRMVMLRSFTAGQLLRAKWLAHTAVMMLYFTVYLLLSAAAGLLFFETHDPMQLFYHDHPVSLKGMIGYTLMYYGLAFLTVLAIGSVFMAAAVISRTTTGAVGLGLGFLLCSLGFPLVYQLANRVGGLGLPAVVKYLSLTEIQYSGIAVMLGQAQAVSSGAASLAALLVGLGYAVIFGVGSLLVFSKSDRWM
ncbi:ABC-type transport system involved in multi-copper enzyme maturation permease subunit [Paenibacillus rhizosphaerae]|uniref:ABC-type transport system involved in multi-copper enzyme maturation permease subunit n=1 Tax=Paenibacillus rhizosphaerae TaxID=297318 RepID=A0A839TK40_9BACL|nr:ABC transporter permease [Paenibacillus rhizosphaerae]MBB3126110.1 ABC-type transport system involved in multi-copper enzyme maturation permease subunit [Paenibacillus rhizosphaerae]